MLGSRVLERAKIALTTGQWWVIPWWQADQYYADGLIARDDAEAAFAQLEETFDAEWMVEERDAVIARAKKWLKEHQQEIGENAWLLDLREELDSSSEPSEAYMVCQLIGFYPAHPLFNEFLSEGALPFQYLANLGLNLLAAKEAELLRKGLAKRLKNSDQFLGAHFELEFLAHLIRSGYSVEREPPSGVGERKADFKVSKGSEILFIELKRLQPSRTNMLVSHIFNLVFHAVVCDPLVSSTPSILSLELSEELRAKAETEVGRSDLIDNWQVTAKQIKDHVIEKTRGKKWGHHIVPGLAEYDFSPREGSGPTGHFAGFPLLQGPEVDRVFRNAVEDALKQLPVEGPGVLIVHPPFPLEPNVFEQIALPRFERSQQEYQHLSAIILVYTFFGESKIQHRLDVVKNPYAAHDVSVFAIMKDTLSLGTR